MGAANSSGGVMGKMIDAQSIVVASTPPTGTDMKARSCASCSNIRSRWHVWSRSRDAAGLCLSVHGNGPEVHAGSADLDEIPAGAACGDFFADGKFATANLVNVGLAD
jgi:hypothetical protein